MSVVHPASHLLPAVLHTVYVPNLVTVTADVSQGICPTAAVLRWNQPTAIQECIAGYTVETTTTSGSWNTYVTSTTATVNINSSECCLMHTFTVTPVYVQVGARNTSDPVSLVPGQSSKTIRINGVGEHTL